jgi:hypothetical protein
MPLGGVDGKEPVLAFKRWRRPPGPKAILDLAKRYPTANVGALTGLSGLTVVDVDDPELIDDMVRRCGDTPLMTETPSGGRHHWYRSDGEASVNLRDRKDAPVAVDVKGIGGLVVVPPSYARIGEHAGKPYRFIRGGWDDLRHLPKAHPGSLPKAAGGSAAPQGAAVQQLRAVPYHIRNITLHKLLLRQVRHCDTEEDLIDIANTIVADHFELANVPPFPLSEIRKTAHSVWQTEKEGRNWVGKEARFVVTVSELDALEGDSDAFMLWFVLQRMHGARAEPFAVAPKAMAHAEVVRGWTGVRRYMKARDRLLGCSGLVRVHVGGRGRGDPHMYRLGSPINPDSASSHKGTESAPNTKRTPWGRGRARRARSRCHGVEL